LGWEKEGGQNGKERLGTPTMAGHKLGCGAGEWQRSPHQKSQKQKKKSTPGPKPKKEKTKIRKLEAPSRQSAKPSKLKRGGGK